MITYNAWSIGKKVIFLILCCSPLFSIGQKTQKLYFYAEQGNTAQESILNNFKNVSRIYMFYQNFFISGTKFNPKVFDSFCSKLIPNVNQYGYAVLDWEGDEFNILRGVNKVSDQRYNDVLNSYIEIVQYAKKSRPNILWSFYDCNPAQYPGMTTSGMSFDNKMAPLLKELDFFSTSLYLRDSFSQTSRITNYLNSNVVESLRLGKIYGKKVLPFIWHRYHDAARLNNLIAKTDFNKYVQSILDVKYQERKVDGVIWWNSESYLSRMNAQNKSSRPGYSTTTNALTYQGSLFNDYIGALPKTLNLK
jgi:hypothetical protein